MKSSSKGKRSRLVYVMIEGQNAETAVKWAKCFLYQKDMAETLLSFGKLHAIFQNLEGFAVIDEVLSHFYGLNGSRKKTLNQPLKSTTLNIIIVAQQTMAPICLHQCQTNAGKFRRMLKITSH